MPLPLGKSLNLANILTIIRLILVPVFLILLFFDKPLTNILSCAVFVVAGVTDYLDGHIARTRNMVTDLGKIIDPIADKVLVASALIALVDLGRVPAWVVILLLAREFIVGALRDFASSKGIIIAALASGKLKTVLQMVAIGCLVFQEDLLFLPTFLIGQIVMYASLVVSLYSLVPYIKAFREMTDA